MIKKIYEVTTKVYVLKDIKLKNMLEETAHLIDVTLQKNNKYKILHEENKYKFYSFSGLEPISNLHRAGELRSFKIRTVNKDLAEYLQVELFTSYTPSLKVLVNTLKMFKTNKIIDRIYTTTPTIAKFEEGYWEKAASIEKLKERLRINLIKKYRAYTGEELDETKPFWESFTIKNKYPIVTKYKGITLLGDKIEIRVAGNDTAQKLAQFAVGTGLLEMNARGYGFTGFVLQDRG